MFKIRNKVTILLIIIISLVLLVLANYFRKSESAALCYLYLINKKEFTFNNLILNVPYYYIRTEDKDCILLTKFPENSPRIFIRLNYYLDKDKFIAKYKMFILKINSEVIYEGEQTVDNNNSYYIRTYDKNHNLTEVYAIIPSKGILITIVDPIFRTIV